MESATFSIRNIDDIMYYEFPCEVLVLFGVGFIFFDLSYGFLMLDICHFHQS